MNKVICVGRLGGFHVFGQAEGVVLKEIGGIDIFMSVLSFWVFKFHYSESWRSSSIRDSFIFLSLFICFLFYNSEVHILGSCFNHMFPLFDFLAGRVNQSSLKWLDLAACRRTYRDCVEGLYCVFRWIIRRRKECWSIKASQRSLCSGLG